MRTGYHYSISTQPESPTTRTALTPLIDYVVGHPSLLTYNSELIQNCYHHSGMTRTRRTLAGHGGVVNQAESFAEPTTETGLVEINSHPGSNSGNNQMGYVSAFAREVLLVLRSTRASAAMHAPLVNLI